MYVADTIVAIATPPGPGGIGIVRVSGSLAERIAERLVIRRKTGPWCSHRMYTGHLLGLNGEIIDEILAVLMHGPCSHTGEDVLELHCHGSPAVLQRALETVLHAGARAAEPGEFTRRAFLNGKLDLVQAEAIADLSGASSLAAAKAAGDQLLGRLSESLESLRKRILGVKARLEAGIDFPEDEVPERKDEILAELEETCRETETLLRTYRSGRIVREGLRVAILGRPNVGKSSLMNALLGSERAIVTEEPGTTRDFLEERADFGGVPVVLLDTAGLREDAGTVERLGMERAREIAERADIRLIILDRSVPPDIPGGNFPSESSIAVLNKVDLPSAWTEKDREKLQGLTPVVEISARHGTGLDALRGAVVEKAGVLPVGDGLPIISRARHYHALQKVREFLGNAVEALTEDLPVEIVAAEIQGTVEEIAWITGAVTSEDVLDLIFAEFCIGK